MPVSRVGPGGMEAAFARLEACATEGRGQRAEGKGKGNQTSGGVRGSGVAVESVGPGGMEAAFARLEACATEGQRAEGKGNQTSGGVRYRGLEVLLAVFLSFCGARLQACEPGWKSPIAIDRLRYGCTPHRVGAQPPRSRRQRQGSRSLPG